MRDGAGASSQVLKDIIVICVLDMCCVRCLYIYGIMMVVVMMMDYWRVLLYRVAFRDSR